MMPGGMNEWFQARMDLVWGFKQEQLREENDGGRVLALQDDPYTPSTHTSMDGPCNGGINGYSTSEHGLLLQGEPSIIASKWGY
jgi:hypothetical protein